MLPKIFLTLVLFSSILLAGLNALEDYIESPQRTNFGRWGRFENCSDELVVTGFQMRIEAFRKGSDNTALNGIRFFCGFGGTRGFQMFKKIQNITSSVGNFGETTKAQLCSTYAVGFELKSQEYQGPSWDDVAGVNLKLICADGTELPGVDDEGVYRNSSYTGKQICPENMAICGIQTQVERFQLFGDDTSLNNVRAKCCPGPVIATTTRPTEVTEGSTESVTSEPSNTVEVTPTPEEVTATENVTPEKPVEFTTEQPLTQEPQTEQPITQEPQTEQPITQEPQTEQPLTQDPQTEQPLTQEPETEKPQEPQTEQPITQEPQTEQPLTQEPETEKPITQEPQSEQSLTQEPQTEQTLTQEPETEKPHELETEKPSTLEPQTEQPLTQEPETVKPQEPETEKPPTQEPQTEQPLTQEPSTPETPALIEEATTTEVSTEAVPSEK